MKVYKIQLLIAVTLTLFFIGCNSGPTLQKYIVESKENSEFISIDLPSSILKLKDSVLSEEVENTLKTIKKVNFLALQASDSNKDFFMIEKEKVFTILKNPDYKELIRVNNKKGKMTIHYLGDDNGVNEVVIFGSENTKGFALVRVLGDQMNPAEIMQISKQLQLDNNNAQLGQIGDLIKNLY